MKLYAIVDENLIVARHLSKGTAAVFTDLKMLKKHAWRYKSKAETYKIAHFEIEELHEFEEE